MIRKSRLSQTPEEKLVTRSLAYCFQEEKKKETKKKQSHFFSNSYTSVPSLVISIMANTTPLHGCELTYFPIPGRAETTRLMLAAAGVSYNDKTITGKDWPTLKPTTLWGSMPFLTLANGTVIGQSRTIDRFVAQTVGFYPEDHLTAARCEQIGDALADVAKTIMKVGAGLTKPELEKARQESCQNGAIKALLDRIESVIGLHGSEGHAVGAELTVTDFSIFAGTATMVSGHYDGIPKDVFENYPRMQSIRKRVATLPKVAAYIAKRGPGAWQYLASV